MAYEIIRDVMNVYKSVKKEAAKGASQYKNRHDDRIIFASMLIGAILSLIASFVLSYEAVKLAADPAAVLSCSVNIIINCATVAVHPSSQLFGFPNSFLGLMAEPVIITVAVAGLIGIRFPRLFMFLAQIGYSLGFVFAIYLLGVSMFVIGALCPWCLLVTLSTILVFFAITRFNIREKNLYLPKKVSERANQFIAKGYDRLTLAIFVVTIIAAIIIKYGSDLFA